MTKHAMQKIAGAIGAALAKPGALNARVLACVEEDVLAHHR